MIKKSVNITALMCALLASGIAFIINASMLGPVLITIGQELHCDEAQVGLSQTAFFTSYLIPRPVDAEIRK